MLIIYFSAVKVSSAQASQPDAVSSASQPLFSKSFWKIWGLILPGKANDATIEEFLISSLIRD